MVYCFRSSGRFVGGESLGAKPPCVKFDLALTRLKHFDISDKLTSRPKLITTLTRIKPSEKCTDELLQNDNEVKRPSMGSIYQSEI